MTKLLLIFSLCALMTACASTVDRLPALPSNAAAAYRLGAGDSLQVVVFGEADLSGTYRVSDSGSIAVPLVGPVPAEGLTLEQLQQRLVERLKATAVRAPSVTLSINEYRPFFILGEVKTPGSYPYVPKMTVLTAVAIAGGFTYRASEDEVSVTRHLSEKAVEARASRDATILPGDVIYVFERHL
jgi:polysaccharide export outer membrane protein